ncbi:MAG: SHOCT domain-containing protein, partial [Anaerolineae bacterium]|nr:SHOCT domain-containing protein [Anaerolineae bacterium]
PLLCDSGEQAVQESRTQSDLRGTVHSVELYCESEDGARRDVSGGLFVLGAIGFSVPFVGGLLLSMVSLGGIARRKTRQMMQDPQAALAQLGIAATPSTPRGVPGMAASGTLADKLRQLEQARDQGLITVEEYERARQGLLNGNF